MKTKKSTLPTFISMAGMLLIIIIAQLQSCSEAHASQFQSTPTPDGRVLLYSIPENFNGSAVIFFHGATGSGQVLLDNAPTNDFIQKMLSAGFIVALPSARVDFIAGPFHSAWESDTPVNPDTAMIDWIIDQGRKWIPQLKNVNLVGGSNGVSMASRMAKHRSDIHSMVYMNGLDCDQFTVNNDGTITAIKNFNVPANMPPTLMIVGNLDERMALADKINLLNITRNAGNVALMENDPTAPHNWGDWTIPFHDNMVNWMLR